MALINCPECSQEISDTCATCPSCGYKLENEIDMENEKSVPSKKKHKKIIVSIVLGLVIVGIILSLTVFSSSPIDYIAKYNQTVSSNEKELIQAESHLAFICSDIVKRLKDPSSFKLTTAIYSMGGDIALEVKGRNSYGALVSNIWCYQYNQDTGTYSYDDTISDLNDETVYDWMSKEQKIEASHHNRTRAKVQLLLYFGHYATDKMIENINSLFEKGQLNNINVVRYFKTE